EDGMRLDRWFRSHYPGLAFSHLQKLCRTGQVRLDGMRVKTSDRVSRGQTVRVPPVTIEADAGARPQPKPARADDATFLRAILLHEDRDVFVFNKPTGLAVQGGSGTRRHIDGMLAALAGKDGQKPRLVHRLDKDTSGVLVVARTRKSASE